MEKTEFDKKLSNLFENHTKFISKKNKKLPLTKGVYEKYKRPILTKRHAPIFWRYDLDYKTNPHLMERLGVNTTFNAGAIELNKKFYIIARVEGVDVKSFFAVAESDDGINNFKFWDRPLVMPVNNDPEMNVYDIRLTKHEDGWIYGLFCAERKDLKYPDDGYIAVLNNTLPQYFIIHQMSSKLCFPLCSL